MAARNTRRGLFDDQSAPPLTAKERAEAMKGYMEQERQRKMKKRKTVPCDTDEECMGKNPHLGGDGGY